MIAHNANPRVADENIAVPVHIFIFYECVAVAEHDAAFAMPGFIRNAIPMLHP